MFCFFGDEVTNRFIEISDSIYDLNWYMLPIRERRLMSVMMLVTQKPVYLEGIANIQCTRENFKKVLKIYS